MSILEDITREQLVGTWKPVSWCSVPGVSPIHPITSSSTFAEFTFFADGTGYTNKKALVGWKRESIVWNVEEYTIFTVFFASPRNLFSVGQITTDNKMTMQVAAQVPGLEGAEFYFEKQ